MAVFLVCPAKARYCTSTKHARMRINTHIPLQQTRAHAHTHAHEHLPSHAHTQTCAPHAPMLTRTCTFMHAHSLVLSHTLKLIAEKNVCGFQGGHVSYMSIHALLLFLAAYLDRDFMRVVGLFGFLLPLGMSKGLKCE